MKEYKIVDDCWAGAEEVDKESTIFIKSISYKKQRQ